MQAIDIAIELSSPMFLDSEHPIYLDALLAYAGVKDMEEQGIEEPWTKTDEYLSQILDRTSGDDWVWKASMLQKEIGKHIEFQPMIRKCDPPLYYENMYTEDTPNGVWVARFKKDGSLIAPNGSSFKIDAGSGHQRSYFWLSAQQMIPRITAHAIGDLEKIQTLLQKHIKHVGKVGRNGFGKVLSITCSKSDQPEAWRKRVLPLNETEAQGIQYAPVQSCLRAPYWKDTARIVAKEPILN